MQFSPGGLKPGVAAAEIRIISRKDAKAAKKQNEFPNLAFFAPWREACPNPKVSTREKFACLAQILKYGNKEDTKVSDTDESDCVLFVVRCFIRRANGMCLLDLA